jgi:hypothetical protein
MGMSIDGYKDLNTKRETNQHERNARDRYRDVKPTVTFKPTSFHFILSNIPWDSF